MTGPQRLLRAAFGLLALALVSGGVVAAQRFRAAGRGDLRQVPTFEVKEGPFTRQVLAEGWLKPVETTVVTVPAEARDALMISWMLDDGDPVKKGDVVIRFNPDEVMRKLADGEGERAAAESRMAREKVQAETAISERDRTAALTREEINNARQLGKKDPRFFPRTEVAESELDESLSRRRLQHARRARAIEKSLAQSKIDLLAIERRKADLVRRQYSRMAGSLEIRAPHDGTFALQNWGYRGTLRAGDRAYPGMRLAEISTSHKMDAEVFVLEADAGGLARGKSATVVLEARPDVVWKAKIKNVDPFPKRRMRDVPAQYFSTLLELESDTAGLKPGQRLHATIVLDEQSRALVVPRQAVFHRDNETWVFRRRGSRFETVKVEIGAGTAGRLVITRGVQPGDHLALRDPTQSADEPADRRERQPTDRGAEAPAGSGSR